MKRSLLGMLLLVSAASFAVDVPLEMSWDCPTARVDQTPFDCLTEVSTYRIYNAKTNTVVASTMATNHTLVIDSEANSTPQFYVTVVDLAGIESAPSNTPTNINLTAPQPLVMIMNYGTVIINPTGN